MTTQLSSKPHENDYKASVQLTNMNSKNFRLLGFTAIGAGLLYAIWQTYSHMQDMSRMLSRIPEPSSVDDMITNSKLTVAYQDMMYQSLAEQIVYSIVLIGIGAILLVMGRNQAKTENAES